MTTEDSDRSSSGLGGLESRSKSFRRLNHSALRQGGYPRRDSRSLSVRVPQIRVGVCIHFSESPGRVTSVRRELVRSSARNWEEREIPPGKDPSERSPPVQRVSESPGGDHPYTLETFSHKFPIPPVLPQVVRTFSRRVQCPLCVVVLHQHV